MFIENWKRKSPMNWDTKEDDPSQQILHEVNANFEKIYDLNDRNKLNIAAMTELKEKMKSMETQIDDHLTMLKNGENVFEKLISHWLSMIETFNHRMMEEEIEVHNKEIMNIQEKYALENEEYGFSVLKKTYYY